ILPPANLQRPSRSHLSQFYFFFLSLIIRPPPTTTLFPYTTLFRSHKHVPDLGEGAIKLRPSQTDKYLSLTITIQAKSKKQLDALDRKSTRLNSSHRTISYAVFCLKKKKEDI